MRIFVTKTDTDLQALSQQLLRRPSAASTTLERVMALNPHVKNFERLAAGTVLILPDAPDLKAGAGVAAGSEGLGDLLDEVSAGLQAITERVGAGFAQLETDYTAVTSALKSAASKRLVEGDPALKQQLESAVARYKEDRKRAADTGSQLKEARTQTIAELAQLQKLLGQ
jgi:uncharacterized phage infection (PIP) family protein YhgE